MLFRNRRLIRTQFRWRSFSLFFETRKKKSIKHKNELCKKCLRKHIYLCCSIITLFISWANKLLLCAQIVCKTKNTLIGAHSLVRMPFWTCVVVCLGSCLLINKLFHAEWHGFIRDRFSKPFVWLSDQPVSNNCHHNNESCSSSSSYSYSKSLLNMCSSK